MKKKFLIMTCMIVLFMAPAGFWGYDKYFRPHPEIQQQLNNQFGAEFFNSFNDENTVNNSGVADNSKPVDDLAKKNDIPIPNASTPVNENNVVQKITQEEINNKYKPKFSYLQNVALSRLDTLYLAAIQEYVQSSKAGTLNRPELVRKYIQAGTMLEANVDGQFYNTLTAMQAELIANNLSLDVVGVHKIEYEKAKSYKRSKLLAKVL